MFECEIVHSIDPLPLRCNGGVKVSTNRRKYMRIESSFLVKTAYLHVFMYFLHLELTFTPHYIIIVKSPLANILQCFKRTY